MMVTSVHGVLGVGDYYTMYLAASQSCFNNIGMHEFYQSSEKLKFNPTTKMYLHRAPCKAPCDWVGSRCGEAE